MPLIVIPATKEKALVYNAEEMWKKEDEVIPKELDRNKINSIVGGLAEVQMAINQDDYSSMYFPFFRKAVMLEAFQRFGKDLPKELTREYEWVEKTYNTNDKFLIYTRIQK